MGSSLVSQPLTGEFYQLLCQPPLLKLQEYAYLSDWISFSYDFMLYN